MPRWPRGLRPTTKFTTNVVELNEAKYAEHPIERRIPYFHNPYCFGYACKKFIVASSSNRFNFLTSGDFTIGNSILVFDIFLGIGKELLPKNPNKIKKIWVCVYLSPNRGFLVYETPTECVRISIVSIDFTNEIYEFIGCSQELSLRQIHCYYDIPCLDGSLVLLGGTSSPPTQSQTHLHVFKFDYSFSKIISHRTIVVGQYSGLFNSINGKLIFTNVYKRPDGVALSNFIFIEEDNSFVEVENTNVHFKQEQFYPGRCDVDGYWHENRAFIVDNLLHSKIISPYPNTTHPCYPYKSHPFFAMFELETKVWSEIRINFPSKGIYHQIHIDADAILSVVTYYKIDETCYEFSELRAALIRIALKKPDKLINLCWFRARHCGFSNKFTHLIS